MNIVVTGASKGIGFETVLALNTDPKNEIVAIARNEEKLRLLKKRSAYPDNISILPFDLERFELYETVLKPKLNDAFEAVDILINNAGVLIKKEFEKQNYQDYDKQFNLNIKAPFALIQLMLPYFNKKAHVLNISSMGGVQGSSKFSGLALYSSSKGALAVLTESIAEEFKDQDIRCNCLALGATQTEMLAEAFPAYKAPVSASEMANYIADFAIKGHYYFNGKILPVALTTL
ncbi:MAG: SDR family oxidoreductase [Bacteroidetes bacterium]|nr:SDR family oxidoreductase [Bacteroidota bacterium]